MKSDKQIYKIFSALPEGLFQLAGIKIKCKYKMESITLKEIESRIDSVFIPDIDSEPVYLVEFQGYVDESIYERMLMEYLLFKKHSPKRIVYAIICFTEMSIDNKKSDVSDLFHIGNNRFKVFYLDEELKKLEKIDKSNPLVLVFKPLIEAKRKVSEESYKNWYNEVKNAKLDNNLKEELCAVILNWFMIQNKDKHYKEVLKMLGIDTTLEETVAYKEIFAEGEKNGKIEGEKNGKIEGEKNGKIEGEIGGLHAQISLIEDFYKKKYIPNEEYQQQRQILEKKLTELEISLKKMIKTVIPMVESPIYQKILEEGKIEDAKNLYNEGFNFELIKKVTGLSTKLLNDNGIK